MWVRVQAVARLPRSKPCGHSAIGVRSVSWVGVIADFASHSSGPRPTIEQERARVTSVDDPQRPAHRRGRQSAAETMPRDAGARPGRAAGSRLERRSRRAS